MVMEILTEAEKELLIDPEVNEVFARWSSAMAPRACTLDVSRAKLIARALYFFDKQVLLKAIDNAMSGKPKSGGRYKIEGILRNASSIESFYNRGQYI